VKTAGSVVILGFKEGLVASVSDTEVDVLEHANVLGAFCAIRPNVGLAIQLPALMVKDGNFTEVLPDAVAHPNQVLVGAEQLQDNPDVALRGVNDILGIWLGRPQHVRHLSVLLSWLSANARECALPNTTNTH
jgi:hypothetical protein